jgi:flagellar FliL protein
MQKILVIIGAIFILGSTQVWSASDEAEIKKTNSAYVSLGKPMVLNLKGKKNRLTFLQVQADALIKDDNSEAIVKTHIPAIRHVLIVLLSEQDALDMKSSDKREEIRNIATAQVKKLMLELADNKDITDILFSSFLVQ